MQAYWAHALQCCSSESPGLNDRGLSESALVAGKCGDQGSPMVQELVGMVPNKIHVLKQELHICLTFSGYGTANEEWGTASLWCIYTSAP